MRNLNFVLMLKKLLNSITDKDLADFDLWVNNENVAKMAVVEDKAICLITEDVELKINGLEW